MRQNSCKKTVINIVALVLACAALVPFIWSLIASFTSTVEVGPQFFNPANFTLENYLYILFEFPYPRWFLNSIIVSVIVCCGNLLVNTMAAYAMARIGFKGHKFFLWLTISLMMIPSQVLLAPTYLLLTKLDWIATYQGLTVPFLFNLFNIFLIHQFLLDIPRDLEEAGEIDGLNPVGIFIHIIVPLSKPILITQTILAFSSNWNSYLWPSLIGNVEKFYTLPVGLNSFYGIYYQDANSVLAGVMLLTFPIMIFYMVFQKYITGTNMQSGIKG